MREFPDHADLFDIGALQLGNQYIANHNGLLGRYPGADGMKTGFTCPAGFNVVASANHSGRRLIVVVLGAPTARSRNQEAADLFDRGFAMGGGSGSLESLPSSGSGAPNMRADVCLRRNAAAIAAAEDEGLAEPIQAAASAGRGMPFLNNPFSALIAPAHTVLSDERIRFDPVRVFVGPAPGLERPGAGRPPDGDGVRLRRRSKRCRRPLAGAPRREGEVPAKVDPPRRRGDQGSKGRGREDRHAQDRRRRQR